jgi:hypothetical protein
MRVLDGCVRCHSRAGGRLQVWTDIEEYFFDYERFEEMCVAAVSCAAAERRTRPVGGRLCRRRAPQAYGHHCRFQKAVPKAKTDKPEKPKGPVEKLCLDSKRSQAPKRR